MFEVGEHRYELLEGEIAISTNEDITNKDLKYAKFEEENR